mgnify:CR=1 FL=1
MTNEYKRVQVPLTEEIKHLRWRLEQTEQRAERAERERDELKATIQEILDTLPQKINESDPCPVCWTYTHKGWCWYEQAKAALNKHKEDK